MGNVTIKDVASEARLSIATVSYVLNQKENLPEETKKLVYVRNYSARSLVSKTSILIGVVIPQVEPGKEMMFENPFYSEILSSIEYNARKRGYHVMISGSNADENYFKLANQRNLDGVILIGVYSENFFRGMKKTIFQWCWWIPIWNLILVAACRLMMNTAAIWQQNICWSEDIRK